jgi:methionine-rich copper-binding protein CopC
MILLAFRVLMCGVAEFGCVLLFAQFLWAHAVLLQARPAKDAAVGGSPLLVELRFNCRIDGERSRLTLVLPDRTLHPLAIQRQTSPDSLRAQDSSFQPGSYLLRWQVLAPDGHITRGEIPFVIK